MTAPSKSDTETTPSRAVVVSDACSLRPFEEQSDLEKTLRAALYLPTMFLRDVDSRIAKFAKAKNYQAAADLTSQKINAEFEKRKWEDILYLYEKEFHSANTERGEG